MMWTIVDLELNKLPNHGQLNNVLHQEQIK